MSQLNFYNSITLLPQPSSLARPRICWRRWQEIIIFGSLSIFTKMQSIDRFQLLMRKKAVDCVERFYVQYFYHVSLQTHRIEGTFLWECVFGSTSSYETLSNHWVSQSIAKTPALFNRILAFQIKNQFCLKKWNFRKNCFIRASVETLTTDAQQ